MEFVDSVTKKDHGHGSKGSHLLCRSKEKNSIKTYEQKAIQAFVAIV